MAATATKTASVNGLDVDALRQVIRDLSADPAKGQIEFRVRSEWCTAPSP